MTTIVTVGVTVLDMIFMMETLPEGGGKYRASERLDVGGGNAANAAVALARLGATARLISCVGNDPTGREIEEDLRRENVDLSAFKAIQGRTSPLSAVLVDKSGERIIVNHRDRTLFDAYGPVDASTLDDADAVLADTRWPEAAVHLMQSARRKNIPAVLDFEPNQDGGLESMAAAASHIVFAEEALSHWTGEAEPERGLLEAARRCDGHVAVSLGAHGILWRTDTGQFRRLAAFDVDVVDTTGAGDALHAGVTLALARGKRFEEALVIGSAVAALKCTKKGSRNGLPDARALQRFLEDKHGDLSG